MFPREKTRKELTSPFDDCGTGRFGNVTSASLTSIANSGGTSSSSYSRACRLSLSGEGSRSESGPEAVGDAGSAALQFREDDKKSGEAKEDGYTDLRSTISLSFPKRSDICSSSSFSSSSSSDLGMEVISTSWEGRVRLVVISSSAPARLDIALEAVQKNCCSKRILYRNFDYT